MSTLTEYLVLAKKRLAVTCDRRNILKREYDPLFFNFEAACDDLSKLIRICEIQRVALEVLLSKAVFMDVIEGTKFMQNAIQAADEIAREK